MVVLVVEARGIQNFDNKTELVFVLKYFYGSKPAKVAIEFTNFSKHF